MENEFRSKWRKAKHREFEALYSPWYADYRYAPYKACHGMCQGKFPSAENNPYYIRYRMCHKVLMHLSSKWPCGKICDLEALYSKGNSDYCHTAQYTASGPGKPGPQPSKYKPEYIQNN